MTATAAIRWRHALAREVSALNVFFSALFADISGLVPTVGTVLTATNETTDDDVLEPVLTARIALSMDIVRRVSWAASSATVTTPGHGEPSALAEAGQINVIVCVI